MILRTYYQKVRGLRSKTNEMFQAVSSNNYDIIALTWLKTGVYNGEFIDQRYETFRKDRNFETSNKLDGGGVSLSILKSSNYSIISRDEWQLKSVENHWVSLKPRNDSTSLHVNCVYLPGDASYKLLEEYLSKSSKILSKTCKARVLHEFGQTCNLDQFNQFRSVNNGFPCFLVGPCLLKRACWSR